VEARLEAKTWWYWARTRRNGYLWGSVNYSLALPDNHKKALSSTVVSESSKVDFVSGVLYCYYQDGRPQALP